MPNGTATKEQVESSSAGIEGFAKYIDLELENSEYAQAADSMINSDKPHIDLLTRVGTQSISVIGPKAEEWEEIEITVDSGACDTVLPSRMLSSIKLEQNDASRRGEEYEVANGCTIPVEGQKRCIMMTIGSMVPKGIVFQVSNVHKPLLSVGSMADAGFDCILSKDGGVMRDRDSGEEIPLVRRGNLYVLRAWVKSAESAFGRQS